MSTKTTDIIDNNYEIDGKKFMKLLNRASARALSEYGEAVMRRDFIRAHDLEIKANTYEDIASMVVRTTKKSEYQKQDYFMSVSAGGYLPEDLGEVEYEKIVKKQILSNPQLRNAILKNVKILSETETNSGEKVHDIKYTIYRPTEEIG